MSSQMYIIVIFFPNLFTPQKENIQIIKLAPKLIINEREENNFVFQILIKWI